ncbi:MAG TPA: ABC transporter substrate-binding protein [Gemmataceae bacterium]|nr:ABC transporter substrate-binding protein [Gemmataceae bacterium]
MTTGQSLESRHAPRLFALAAFLLSASLMAVSAQPPKKGGEEEEDPKAKQTKKDVKVEEEDTKGTVKKKIVVDDGGDTTKKAVPVGSPPDVRLDELIRAAAATKNATYKKLYTQFAVPFDRFTDTKGGVSRIKPVPLHRTDRFPANFGVIELDAGNNPKESRNVAAGEVRRIDAFEEVAVAEVDQLLKYKPLGLAAGPDGLAAEDQLATGETILAAVVRFHEFARDAGKRTGKNWEAPRQALADKLREVRITQLQRATLANDWAKARAFGTNLLNNYPKNNDVMTAVAAARVTEAELLMKSTNHVDFVRAKELLDEFEARFPGGGGEGVRKIRDALSREAARHFEIAKEKKAVQDLVAARDALRKAESLDPSVPGIRDMQRDLKTGYPILYVGVRQFPERMSPAMARFDSERQIVELLFEGLLEEIPDELTGSRYRPGAALTLPLIVPGGREMLLRATERSGPNNREGFDAHDVVGTLKMLRARSDLWISAGLPWLEDLPVPRSSESIRLGFRLGHPDPRSLMTFKLLPARWLTENGKGMDDPDFAARPHGTGPYRLHAITPASGSNPRELVFTDNLAYSKWRDRTGLPHIREVRFVEYGKLLDPMAEIKNDRMHILPDVPTADIEKFMAPSAGLQSKMQVVTAATNRRVYTLAVNHRRPVMQNHTLRRGLSLAIDRDAILHDVFRANRIEFHKPMTGPFPPNSWAVVRGPGGIAPPLVNRDLATVLLMKYLDQSAPKTDLTLAYPDGDPLAQAACEKIKAQVESLVKDLPPARRLVLKLEPLPARELIKRVEDEWRYDLAYVPFDYPDDWYPFALSAMLDPSAGGRSGRNVFGYLTQVGNPEEADLVFGRELAGLRAHRDFGEVMNRTKRISDTFNERVPFIPLWQLDRHMLVSNRVKFYADDAEPMNPRAINPTTLFGGIARWRLE